MCPRCHQHYDLGPSGYSWGPPNGYGFGFSGFGFGPDGYDRLSNFGYGTMKDNKMNMPLEKDEEDDAED
jgi:hypothetical protein